MVISRLLVFPLGLFLTISPSISVIPTSLENRSTIHSSRDTSKNHLSSSDNVKIQVPGSNLPGVSPTLPKAIADRVIQDLRTRLGLPQSSPITITQVRPTRLPVCLPTPGAPGTPPQCATAYESGWRATLRAKQQNWQYSIPLRDEKLVFEVADSIPTAVKNKLATHLNLAPSALKIKAAELITEMPCQVHETCPEGYHLSWRVLVEQQGSERFFHLDNQGNERKGNLKPRPPIAGLPGNLQSLVLQDVMNRHEMMPPNLRIEGVRSLTWQVCRGEILAREMDTCVPTSRSGWQVQVRAGAFLHQYYLETKTNGNAIAPEARQSIYQGTIDHIKRDINQHSKAPLSQLKVEQVRPRFFNGCLDIPGDNCRNEIQAGWTILVSYRPVANAVSPAWMYHADLVGGQVKLVRKGTWSNGTFTKDVVPQILLPTKR
jgi:hypothetical protein